MSNTSDFPDTMRNIYERGDSFTHVVDGVGSATYMREGKGHSFRLVEPIQYVQVITDEYGDFSDNDHVLDGQAIVTLFMKSDNNYEVLEKEGIIIDDNDFNYKITGEERSFYKAELIDGPSTYYRSNFTLYENPFHEEVVAIKNTRESRRARRADRIILNKIVGEESNPVSETVPDPDNGDTKGGSDGWDTSQPLDKVKDIEEPKRGRWDWLFNPNG